MKGMGNVDWKIITIISDSMNVPPSGERAEKAGTEDTPISIAMATAMAVKKPRSAFAISCINAPAIRHREKTMR